MKSKTAKMTRLGIGRPTRRRNDKVYDRWSWVHLLSAALLAWVMDPALALAITVLWEPLEILVLSPLLARANIEFGYESLRNSLSDIVFDFIGVGLGYFVLARVVSAPFHLF